jgi:hypothetical protein
VNWGSVTWDEFERALVEYRDAEYAGRSPISGENAYLLILAELTDVPLADRGAHVDSLILFLNRWACHFPTRTPNTRVALRNWIIATGSPARASPFKRWLASRYLTLSCQRTARTANGSTGR